MKTKEGAIYGNQGRHFSTSLLFDSYDSKRISNLKPKTRDTDEFTFTAGIWRGKEQPSNFEFHSEPLDYSVIIDPEI
jgi:hypothetical protein